MDDELVAHLENDLATAWDALDTASADAHQCSGPAGRGAILAQVGTGIATLALARAVTAMIAEEVHAANASTDQTPGATE